jgi:2-keto-4-pentenoate hydratase/2-oxohepta-3-ene-1,7-dioic acid hydratase in catechol pathway
MDTLAWAKVNDVEGSAAMRQLFFRFVAAAAIAGAFVDAQTVTPFKLGTFERQGRPFIGIVVGDSTVIDFAAAHAAVRTPASTLTAPTDMKDVIARYNAGVRQRIVDVMAAVASAGAARPAYVYDLGAVKILPPIMYPTTMLNVAVNYREHDIEMSQLREAAPGQGAPTAGAALPGTRSAPGYWERRADDTRWNPYMFLKASAAVTAHGEPIRLPLGRTQVDWECEMGVVIARQGSRVPAAQAADYIFGYTIENDVSDRGGRGDTRYGSDWVVGKSHDTFAPLGPFITPKEFVEDVRKVPITVDLNGTRVQEGSSSLMIHDVFEQVAYASNILTLRTGDVIATGTPAGVGSARMPPVYLKAGDRISCTYAGIGTLTNPVVAETAATR